MRARDSASSCTRTRTSAWSRSLSRASRAAGPNPRSRLGGVGVVGDDGDGLTVTHERRGDRCAVRERIRQLAAVGIGVVTGGREPVVDAQVPVAESVRQRFVEPTDRRRLAHRGERSWRPIGAATGRRSSVATRPTGDEHGGGAADDEHGGEATDRRGSSSGLRRRSHSWPTVAAREHDTAGKHLPVPRVPARSALHQPGDAQSREHRGERRSSTTTAPAPAGWRAQAASSPGAR